MGIDFNGFLRAAKSAITSAASMQQQTDKVDTNPETESLKAMLSGINKSASTSLDTFELNNLVEQEKASITPFVDDAEILSGLMSALEELEPGINMEKVNEYNEEHPSLTDGATVAETIMNSEDGYVGMDAESFDIISEALGDDASKVFNYMSNAIKDGSASFGDSPSGAK